VYVRKVLSNLSLNIRHRWLYLKKCIEDIYIIDYSDIFPVIYIILNNCFLTMMTESVINCKVNSDDDMAKMKNTKSSSSSSRSSTPTSSLKNKRARLTFPFGAW
jgi:hypothetical protein